MTKAEQQSKSAAIEDGYTQLRDVRLHHLSAGAPPTRDTDQKPPLVLCLHGFPEFSYSWRHQLPALAAAGYRSVAPDMRGYGLSDKPKALPAYRIEALVADMAELIDALGYEQAHVVGHDWGGMVAWWLATLRPERVATLSVLNCPHPGHQNAMLRSLSQLRRSWYMLFFQLPWGIPERWMRRDDFLMLRTMLRREPVRENAVSQADVERYVEAFSRPATDPNSTDAVTAAMHYYRSLLRRPPSELAGMLAPLPMPVQVIWGAQDRHLGVEYARPPTKWAPNASLHLIDDASHWVQVDRPTRVNKLLLDFLPSGTSLTPK